MTAARGPRCAQGVFELLGSSEEAKYSFQFINHFNIILLPIKKFNAKAEQCRHHKSAELIHFRETRNFLGICSSLLL
jgi:hypothetical protein